ncbi:MAG: hypothetical protein WDN23_04765 [Edaphobacter sp.]
MKLVESLPWLRRGTATTKPATTADPAAIAAVLLMWRALCVVTVEVVELLADVDELKAVMALL